MWSAAIPFDVIGLSFSLPPPWPRMRRPPMAQPRHMQNKCMLSLLLCFSALASFGVTAHNQLLLHCVQRLAKCNMHCIHYHFACLHYWGYGATAARLTPDQKVGSSNLSALILPTIRIPVCGLKTPCQRELARPRTDSQQGIGHVQRYRADYTHTTCTHASLGRQPIVAETPQRKTCPCMVAVERTP